MVVYALMLRPVDPNETSRVAMPVEDPVLFISREEAQAKADESNAMAAEMTKKYGQEFPYAFVAEYDVAL
jgi:hypothetical protein